MVAVPLGLLAVVTLVPGPVDAYQHVLAGPFDFRGLDAVLLVEALDQLEELSVEERVHLLERSVSQGADLG